MKLIFKVCKFLAAILWIGLSLAVIVHFSSGAIELFSMGKILQGITWLILFIGFPLVLCFAFYTLLLFPVNYFSIRLSEMRKAENKE